MKVWQVFVLGFLGLVLAGCHSDPRLEALERDNFNKEQKIYRLQNRIEDLEAALNTSAPVETPPGPVATLEENRSGPPSTRLAPPFNGPARTMPAPETPGEGVLRMSPGTEVPSGEVPDRMRTPGQGAPPSSPSSGPSFRGSTEWTPASGQSLNGPLALTDNRPVAQITLHPALTGGIGGGRLGDEGLLVVVEPRDFGGNIVNAPGDISVALLDPALSGEQARLARWDFAAAQTEGMTHTGSQPGIHLRLPWRSTPAHDRLKVFVRYTTYDGRKLQAERLIAVALNGPPARREVLPGADPAETASRPERPQWSPVR